MRAQARIKSLYRSRGILVSGVNVYGVRHREEWQKQLCLQRTDESDTTLRSSRLLAGAEEAGGGRSPSRGEEAPHRPDPGDGARLRTDPRGPAGSDCRDASSLPNEATVLELLRARDRDALELGLGPDGRWGWIKARVPQTRGLSRQHNHFLKSIFKGAATTVITQRNKDPIYARYERLLDGGTKPTLAKLSLARMIAATVLRMWKDEEEYDPGRAGLRLQRHAKARRRLDRERLEKAVVPSAIAKRVRMPRCAWPRR